MKKQFRCFTTICLFLFVGCATTAQFINLDLGMSKKDVINTLGEPELARGAITNKYGQLIEVWEYNRLVSNWSWEKRRMWVHFSNGKLAQWGQAGDWKKEADRIIEIRYK